MEGLLETFFGPWNLGKLIGDTFGVYRKNWLLFIAIVTPFAIIIQIIGSRFSLSINNWASLPEIDYSPSLAFTALLVIIGFTLLDMLITMIITTIMNCPFIHTIGQQYTRERVSIKNASSSAMKRVLTVIMAVLLRGIVIAALVITVIGIPLAIYFYIKWLFVTHSILFESKNVSESLSRSSELVNNSWRRILGYLIILFLIAIAIIITFGYCWDLIKELIPALTNDIIINTIVRIIITPITIIATTLLYFTLRVEKEGYHIGRLIADMDGWDADRKPYYPPDPVIRPSYCSKCGQQLEPQTKFCPNCGKQLIDSPPVAETSDGEEHSDSGPAE
ncbi:zinc ribbon domain-containing protein [Chloroflexota bacterium]